MKPIIKAIVWDMDGVIVDSEGLHYQTMVELLKKYGVDYTQELNNQFFGMRDADVFSKLQHSHGLTRANIEILISQRDELFIQKATLENLPILPGVIKWLNAIRELGLPQALCSSSTMKIIHHVLCTLGLKDFFGSIISGDLITNGKPNPECYRLTARKLNIPAKNCLALEDSINGVKAAKGASMYCIAIPNPKTYSIADYTASSLENAPIANWFDLRGL